MYKLKQSNRLYDINIGKYQFLNLKPLYIRHRPGGQKWSYVMEFRRTGHPICRDAHYSLL